MSRSILVFSLLLAACEAGEPEPLPVAATSQPLSVSYSRAHVSGDVYHHEFVLRVGDGPNATLRLHRVVRERSPYVPRRSKNAIFMMHGDFATFATNFAPVLGTPASSTTGLATWLAERDIDVWGLDRRWTQAPFDGADLSDFDEMGLAQALGDIRVALAFARGVRVITDASLEKMTLLGFSRGGQLAYAYASDEAARPSWQRHVKGLVPVDVYVALAPEDEIFRQRFCAWSADEYDLVANGAVESSNDFQIATGLGVLAGPDDPSPYPGWTNRDVMLDLAGMTRFYYPVTPVYHLAAPVLDESGDFAIALRESDEDVIATWFAGAPRHQSMLESADTDALVCGEAPPLDLPLSRIRVPLFLVAAAGGYGERAIYTTTQVGSSDVTTLVVRKRAPGEEAEDYGHGDLLFARDAPTLAWAPLLSWLRSHE